MVSAFLSQTLFLELSVLSVLLITAIMMLGAALQASAGFGSGLLAVPLLGLVDVRLVPAPVLFAYIFLSAFIFLREREAVSYQHQKFLITGLAFGSVLSLIPLYYIPLTLFPMVAAVLVLIGVGLSLFHSHIPLSRNNLLLGGTVSGLMNTLAGLSGPPMALVLQFQSPSFIRANLALAFIVASCFSIAILAFKGLFSMSDMVLGSIMVPGMFMGVLVGQKFTRSLNAQHSRWIILTLASASAFSLLVKSLLV